jgi:hypothetical protein
MILQTLDGVVRDSDGSVVAALVGRRGHAFVVDRVARGGEVVPLVVHVERSVEPAIEHPAVDVPLAAVIATVADGLEEVRQQSRPRLPHTPDAA